jgi:hypothetical protein
MPAKRRVVKRRLGEREEAALWTELFTHGYDFFDQYADLGFRHEYDMNLAAGEAWRRLGPIYLAEIRPTVDLPRAVMPWALSTFGKPWTVSGSPSKEVASPQVSTRQRSRAVVRSSDSTCPSNL